MHLYIIGAWSDEHADALERCSFRMKKTNPARFACGNGSPLTKMLLFSEVGSMPQLPPITMASCFVRAAVTLLSGVLSIYAGGFQDTR